MNVDQSSLRHRYRSLIAEHPPGTLRLQAIDTMNDLWLRLRESVFELFGEKKMLG